jgi:16S rRNA (guanine527-N7)-methyltransferase
MNKTHPDYPKLASGLARLGLEVSESAIENLLAFVEILKEWSRTYNLIAPQDRNALLGRHVLDSLSIAPWLQPGSLLDVGTGAGFPGLPLAIIRPEMDVTLIDGAGKKIRFIRHVGRTLKLANIHPLHLRVEALEERKFFANITSRAFSSLAEFAEIVRPHMDAGTRLLAMKGAFPRIELEDLPGWVNVQSVEKLSVPYLQAERHLVIMSLSDETTQ